MASPLKTAPAALLSTLVTAIVPTEGAHAAIVPASVAKMKRAGAPGLASKSLLPLNTTPVGVPGPTPPGAGGIVTTKDCGVPLVLYRVETPVPLSETQKGEEPLDAIPHGLTR